MSTSSFTRMKSGGGKCCGGSLAMTSATPASGHHHHGSRSFVLLFPLFLSLCVFPTFVMASRGDRDYTFHNCLVKCKQNSCVGNGMHECIFTIELNAFSFFWSTQSVLFSNCRLHRSSELFEILVVGL